MEWFALIIPTITAVILLNFFKSKVIWWEYVLLFAVAPIVILACKFSAEASMTTDKEYWGAYGTEARYYEAWDEEVSCRHPIYERQQTGTDSKGNPTYSDVYVGDEHLYDVDKHSAYWRLYDNIGRSHYISQGEYNNLKKRWSNQSFHDQHRDFHSYDGDMYKTKWDREDKHIETITTIHRYTNKVQASTSVFNFPEVKDPAGLYEYPSASGLYAPSILGNVWDKASANRILDIHNAKLGSSHQVRIWFLFFTGDMSQALDQENYWKGGNKNEFIVCIGLDKEQNVTWCKPFTWCEVDELTAVVRNEIAGHKGKIDTKKLAEFTVVEVKKKWRRKEFADFNYLTVELPSWAHWMIWIITLLVNVGLAVYVVMNEFDEESESKRKKRRY
jgi:hypothetical protein